MLIINTHNNKLTAAQVNFASRGMLHGTCLGEALQLWHQGLEASDSSEDVEVDSSGPDSNREDSCDVNLNGEVNEDDVPPGPVDGPPIFSEVALTLRRGLISPQFIRNIH